MSWRLGAYGFWMQHENVVVLDLESELVQMGMTRIRDYENSGKLTSRLRR
jgi:hypothetical protein